MYNFLGNKNFKTQLPKQRKSHKCTHLSTASMMWPSHDQFRQSRRYYKYYQTSFQDFAARRCLIALPLMLFASDNYKNNTGAQLTTAHEEGKG